MTTLTEAADECRNAELRLNELLAVHDFTYEMSDDPTVYRKGHEEYKTILALQHLVGPNAFRNAWNKYAPAYMQITQEKAA